VASRKDETDGEVNTFVKPSRRDDVEFNELSINLRISYKTLLLVFVLFDVLHRTVNAVFDIDFL